MKIFMILFVIFSAMTCGGNEETAENAQPIEVITETPASEEEVQDGILVGQFQKEELMQEPYSAWFSPGYESYEPSAEALETIKSNIGEYEIKMFMGTWCGDSRRVVPKFYKLLEKANYDLSKLEAYAVERNKTLPDGLEKEYDLQYVPTIVFLKDGKEVGRFVEYAQETLEQDIAKIVSGQEYSHPYE